MAVGIKRFVRIEGESINTISSRVFIVYFSNLRLIMINLCREALKTVPNHPSSKLVFAGDLSNDFGLVLDHLIYGEKILNNPVNVCFLGVMVFIGQLQRI